MKVLMINSVCGIRSTGRICTDLASELEERGHTVKIAYGRENVPTEFKKYAVRIGDTSDNKMHGLKARLFDADGNGSVRATKAFIRWVEEYDPDIIHLHNLHGYYINVPLLFKYVNQYKKRVIWTFHDMWPFTGHSPICDNFNCFKWKEKCQNCPAYRTYPKSIIDRANKNFEWKKECIGKTENMVIVTPSNWLAGLVKQSFLKDKEIVVINNGIDTNQFYPLENDFRMQYGLEGKIIILGCASSWSRSKGLDDFVTLSQILDSRFKIVLVGIDDEQEKHLPDNILAINRTDSTKELAMIYSEADVFCNLTYADNYPTVNLEALACKTPVITYNTGGSAECINEENGKVFMTGDIEGVANYILKEFKLDSYQFDCSEGISKDKSIRKYSDLLGGGTGHPSVEWD